MSPRVATGHLRDLLQSSARSPEISTVVLATDSFLIGDGLAAILAENPDELAVGDFPSGPVPTECGGSEPHAECAAAACGRGAPPHSWIDHTRSRLAEEFVACVSIADVAACIEGARAQLDIALDAALPELVERLVRARLRARVGLDPESEPAANPTRSSSSRSGSHGRTEAMLSSPGAELTAGEGCPPHPGCNANCSVMTHDSTLTLTCGHAMLAHGLRDHPHALPSCAVRCPVCRGLATVVPVPLAPRPDRAWESGGLATGVATRWPRVDTAVEPPVGEPRRARDSGGEPIPAVVDITIGASAHRADVDEQPLPTGPRRPPGPLSRLRRSRRKV